MSCRNCASSASSIIVYGTPWGALAILGWVRVYIVYRTLSLESLPAVGIVAVSVVLGVGLGWAAWFGLDSWSWGDYGEGHRWAGELAVCVLGTAGWCLAAA